MFFLQIDVSIRNSWILITWLCTCAIRFSSPCGLLSLLVASQILVVFCIKWTLKHNIFYNRWGKTSFLSSYSRIYRVWLFKMNVLKDYCLWIDVLIGSSWILITWVCTCAIRFSSPCGLLSVLLASQILIIFRINGH